MANNEQCSVIWNVDDNKIMHMDVAVVTQIIEAIEKHFGKMMVVSRRKHTFLGMGIYFIGDGTMKIGMKIYIADAIECFGKDSSKGVMTLAQKDIFEIDGSSPKLQLSKANCSTEFLQRYIKQRATQYTVSCGNSMHACVTQYGAGLEQTQTFIALFPSDAR